MTRTRSMSPPHPQLRYSNIASFLRAKCYQMLTSNFQASSSGGSTVRVLDISEILAAKRMLTKSEQTMLLELIRHLEHVPEKKALPPRTAATQAADCAEYRRRIELRMKVSHVNGVHAETLIPIDWDFLIPPWLHLILGTGNEVVKKIYVQLLQLDGVDQVRIDNLAKLEDELTECEERAIDKIVDAIYHLGPDDAAVKALGEDKGAAHMARGGSTELWAPLVDALNALAEDNRRMAREIRNPPERNSTQARSERAHTKAEAQAQPFDEKVRLLEAEAQELTERLVAVANKRKELDLAKDAEVASPSAGEFSAKFQAALKKFRISVQRYWNATLVGPDVRKFLDHFHEILKLVSGLISEKLNAAAKGAAFYETHARVLRPLAVVSALTRTTEQLTEEQMVDLEKACAEFGAAYRLSYEKLLTPKAHIIEVHVGPIVRRLHGWCGCLGEDGLEALHPWDTRCRLIVRSMRNPVAKHEASQVHLAVKKFAEPPKKKRK